MSSQNPLSLVSATGNSKSASEKKRQEKVFNLYSLDSSQKLDKLFLELRNMVSQQPTPKINITLVVLFFGEKCDGIVLFLEKSLALLKEECPTALTAQGDPNLEVTLKIRAYASLRKFTFENVSLSLLKHLRISYQKNDKDMQMLEKLLLNSTALKTLEIHDCTVTQKGSNYIAQGLIDNNREQHGLETLSLIEISDMQEWDWKSLAEAINQSRIRTLFVDQTEIQDQTVDGLVTIIRENQTLQELILGYGTMQDEQVVCLLLQALKYNSEITHVCINNFHNTSIPFTVDKLTEVILANESAKVLAEIIGRQQGQTITQLDLGKNYIGSEGFKLLGLALGQNTTLTLLDLSYNDGMDFRVKYKSTNRDATGIEALAGALESNSTLTSLNLSGNNLDGRAALALGLTLQRNQAIRYLYLSRNPQLMEMEAGNQALMKGLKVNKVLAELFLPEQCAKEPLAQDFLEVYRYRNHTFNYTLRKLAIITSEVYYAGPQCGREIFKGLKSTIFIGENEGKKMGEEHARKTDSQSRSWGRATFGICFLHANYKHPFRDCYLKLIDTVERLCELDQALSVEGGGPINMSAFMKTRYFQCVADPAQKSSSSSSNSAGPSIFNSANSNSSNSSSSSNSTSSNSSSNSSNSPRGINITAKESSTDKAPNDTADNTRDANIKDNAGGEALFFVGPAAAPALGSVPGRELSTVGTINTLKAKGTSAGSAPPKAS